MDDTAKFTIKLFSIPFILLLGMGSINVFAHKFKVISLKNDSRKCIKEYSALIKGQKVNCNKEYCEVTYSQPDSIIEEKQAECERIESNYYKAFNNMPIKF